MQFIQAFMFVIALHRSESVGNLKLPIHLTVCFVNWAEPENLEEFFTDAGTLCTEAPNRAQKHLIHHIFTTMNLTYYSNSYWQKVWSLGSGKNAVSAVVSCSRNAWKNHKKKNHWFVFSNHYTLYPALSWPVAIRARASVVWWLKCRGSGGQTLQHRHVYHTDPFETLLLILLTALLLLLLLAHYLPFCNFFTFCTVTSF